MLCFVYGMINDSYDRAMVVVLSSVEMYVNKDQPRLRAVRENCLINHRKASLSHSYYGHQDKVQNIYELL